MIGNPQSISPAGAIVIDASVAIAFSAKEAGREKEAIAELSRLSQLGYQWYAPGVIVSETLFVLCLKHQNGLLSANQYLQAVTDFEGLMRRIAPPPDGEVSLVLRAYAIAGGCTVSVPLTLSILRLLKI